MIFGASACGAALVNQKPAPPGTTPEQDNLLGLLSMGFQKQVRKKTIKHPVVGHDLLVAILRGLSRQAEFQAVQCA